MSKNLEAVYDYLSNEGFRPKNEDGYISFKFEGDQYMVIFREEDEEFVSLKKFIKFDYAEDKSLEVYKTLNYVNALFIVGKCSLRPGNIFAFEVDTMGGHEGFIRHFTRYLAIILQMQKACAEKLLKVSTGN